MSGFGVFDADVLLVALHVVAFFLGHFIGGICTGVSDLVGGLGARFVLRFELGLGDVFLALGFLHTDVLGVVFHGIAAFLVGLVGRRDAVLFSLVLFLGHGKSRSGHQGGGDRCDQGACEFHGFLLGD
ncbi:hypothetical protein D3C71_1467640 [compost metagenome]